MKAIELMQKLGELVAEHGDIEVVLGKFTREGYFDCEFVRRVEHRMVDSSNQQDLNFISIEEA